MKWIILLLKFLKTKLKQLFTIYLVFGTLTEIDYVKNIK
jgi:hypothetical protein